MIIANVMKAQLVCVRLSVLHMLQNNISYQSAKQAKVGWFCVLLRADMP